LDNTIKSTIPESAQKIEDLKEEIRIATKKSDSFQIEVDKFTVNVTDLLFDRMTTSSQRELAPFEVKTLGNDKFIGIPKGLLNNEFAPIFSKGIFRIMNLCNYRLLPIETEIKIRKSETAELFFKGLFRGLIRLPGKDERPSFGGKTPFLRGDTHAKIIYLKNQLEADQQKLLQYLPEDAFNVGKEGKIEWIHYYLFEMIGDKDAESLRTLRYNIVDLLNVYAKLTKIKNNWSFLVGYKVPLSTVLKGAYKTKLVKKKGVEKARSIKPKAPSTKIESILEEERKFLRIFEECFGEFKNRTMEIKETGVSLTGIGKIEKELKTLIQKKWEVVQKCSAPLRQRELLLLKLLKQEGLTKDKTLTKKSRDELLAMITEDRLKLSDNEMLTISSYYLLNNLTKATGESVIWKELLLGVNKKTNIIKLKSLQRAEELLELLNGNRMLFRYTTYSFDEGWIKTLPDDKPRDTVPSQQLEVVVNDQDKEVVENI